MLLAIFASLPVTAAIVSWAWVQRRRDLLTFQREDVKSQLVAAAKRNSELEAALATRIGALEVSLGTALAETERRMKLIEGGFRKVA